MGKAINQMTTNPVESSPETTCAATNNFVTEKVLKSEFVHHSVQEISKIQETIRKKTHIRENHKKDTILTQVIRDDSRESNKFSADFRIQIKSDLDGFKYIGHAVSIRFSSQELVNPLCMYGVIKFWYPKFGYFFVHLFENDKLEHDDKSVSFLEERCTLELSPFANERGWVSPKDTRVTSLSTERLWSPSSQKKATRMTGRLEEKTSCQCCKKILCPSNTLQDLRKCTLCEKEFHSACLSFLNRKSFTRNVSEEALICDAKEHKEYILHRTHQEKLTNEFKQRQVNKRFHTRHPSLRKRGRHSIKTENEGTKIRKRSENKQDSVGRGYGAKKNPHKIQSKYNSSKVFHDSSSDSTQSSHLSCLSYEKEIFETSRHVPSNFTTAFNATNKDILPLDTLCQTNNLPLKLCEESSSTGLVVKTNWKCPECLVCLYCNENLTNVLPVNLNSKRCFWKSAKKSRGINEVVPWVICYICGLCAHGSCCLPEVPLLHPNARWKCDRCTVCFVCGYKDLQWVDYTAWDPCFLYCFRCYKALQKGNYCSVCRKPLDGVLNEKKNARQCQKCRFPCHIACDNLDNIQEKDRNLTQTSLPYTCNTCREGTLSERCSRLIEAFILYDKKKYFSYPVPLSCLSYWRVVKHPINFFEMKAKTYYNFYHDAKDFLVDLFVTFFNTKIAYMPNTSIYRHATRLEKRAKTISFGILGLGKPTKQQLHDLHNSVEKIASSQPSQCLLIAQIQDCYDFEHLRFFTKEMLGIHHTLAFDGTQAKDLFPQQSAIPYVVPAYATSDRTRHATRYISSKRVDCSLNGYASLDFWWLKKKNTCFILSQKPSSTNQVLDSLLKQSTVNSFLKVNDLLIENFQRVRCEWEKNTPYMDSSTLQYIKTLLDTASAGFDIVCSRCCISGYITNDLNFLNFFSKKLKKYIASCRQPFYCVHCSNCLVCDKSQCLLYTKDFPLVLFPSLVQTRPLACSSSPCPNSLNPVLLHHLEKIYQCWQPHAISLDTTQDDFSWFARQKLSAEWCCICNTMVHSICTRLHEDIKSQNSELLNRKQPNCGVNTDEKSCTSFQNKRLLDQPFISDAKHYNSTLVCVLKNQMLLRQNEMHHKTLGCGIIFMNMPLFLKYFQGFENIVLNNFTTKRFFSVYNFYGNGNVVQLFVALCKLQLSREFSSLHQGYWSQSIMKLSKNPLLQCCDILQNIHHFLPWMYFQKMSYEESLIHDQNVYNFFISLQATENHQVPRLPFVNVCGVKVFLPYTLSLLLKIVQDLKKWTFLCGQCQQSSVTPIDKEAFEVSFPFNYIINRLQNLFFQCGHATTTGNDLANGNVLPSLNPCVKPTLMCQLCGRIVNAWKYKDLCDISSCMLHIPYVCDVCKISMKMDISYDMSTLTLLLQVFSLFFKDLQTRYINTQTVKRILLRFFSVSTLFYENSKMLEKALNTFMDNPVFAPYRYRFLEDSQNFFYKKKDMRECLMQVDFFMESSTKFPLFHSWLTKQSKDFSIPDYTCTNTILTLFAFTKLPFQKSSPFKIEKSKGFPFQSCQDPFSFFYNVTPTIHQRLLQWLSLTKPSLAMYQNTFNQLCFEMSVLLGLYYRFIQWFKLYKFGQVSNDPTLTLYHDAHTCFFQLPKPFCLYLHQIKNMCAVYSFSSLNNQVIQRLQKLLYQTITGLFQFDNSNWVKTSPKCLLCLQTNSNLLLGPLLPLNFSNHCQPESVFVHKECVIWGCVSLLAKYPKIFNARVDPFTHNPFLNKKYASHWFSFPISSSVTLSDFIVKYLYADSVYSICTICHLPHATVFCNKCLIHCFHLPCFIKSMTSRSIDPILRFDLSARRILQCNHCYNPSLPDARPSLPYNQYLGCFVMLLAYIFQSISFAETTLQDAFSFSSKTLKLEGDSFSEAFYQNDCPWLSRRYKKLLMLFEKTLTDLPFFNKKWSSLSQQMPTLFHSSLCHIVCLGSSLRSFQHLKTSDEYTLLYGFHFIRRFWSIKRLLEEFSTPTQSETKSFLTLYSFEIQYNVETNAPIYTITSTKDNTGCDTTHINYEHYYKGNTLESVVSLFYDDLIPALSNWFHINGQPSHIRKENLPSPVNLFGLGHPKVVEHSQQEKSIHDSYFVLDCIKEENGTFSQETNVSINIKKLGTSFRSRVWLSVNPLSQNHSFMLGTKHHYLMHYQDCFTLTPQKWDNLREKYGLYVFESHSEFSVSPTLTQDDILELRNLQDEFPTESLSSSTRVYSRDKKVSRIKTTGNKMTVLKTRPTNTTCWISEKKKNRCVDYSVLFTIMNQDNYIKTCVSPIHGLGLFAVSVIKKGQPIVEYTGHLIRNVIADKREIEYQNSGMKDSSCYMFRLNPYQVVDGTRAGNVSRFINHSCQPNCVCHIITDQYGRQHIIIFSATTIKAGEEITYDYKFNVEEKSRRLVCLCGAPGCLGRMN